MTKHSFSIKFLLLTTIIAFSLLIGSNIWAFAGLQHNSASADTSTTYSATTTESVFYDNFESESGSYPVSPSKFSKITDDSNTATPEKSGVINISSTEYNNYKDSYKLESYTKPAQMSSDNKQALMINALDNSIYYGYKSTSTTLSANSYYEISVAVYTHNKATASVYLDGADFNSLENSQIIKINTDLEWKVVTFYVATSKTNSSTVNIQLYLGSKSHVGNTGAIPSANYVLFDEVSINRLSGENYQRKIDSEGSSSLTQVIDLDSSTALTSGQAGFITNGDFSATPISTGWSDDTSNTGGEINYYSNLNQAVTINSESVILGTHFAENSITSGVVISANKGATVAINSDEITIKQHHIYRIALWAKGELNNSTLNLKVSGTVPNGSDDGLTCSAQYTSFVATEENLNGGWGLYEFYIVGNPLNDTKVTLTLGISSSNSTDSGYVAVSDIKSYLINSEQMSNGTSNNSNAKTVKMYSTENTLAFENYSFNLVSFTETDVEKTVYPLTPTSWTAGAYNQNSGVVNISESEWKNVPFVTSCPSKNNLSGYSDKDNVLMLNANTSGKVQSYTSTSQTLSKDAYAKITFQAYINSTSTAYVTIKNSNDVVIATMPIEKKSSSPTWKEYAIYLHNYMNEQTITATVSLGQSGKTVNGYAYFDNIKFDSSLTQEKFDAVTSSELNAKFDLSANALISTTSADSIEPLLWTMNVSENSENTIVNGGIINYQNASSYAFINENPQNPEGNDSNMIMVIQASEPVYATYNSNLTYSLDASAYYKLTVWVKTTGLTADTQTSEDITVDGELIKHGASIMMTNVDSNFTVINTKNSKNVDEWKLYTMYIYTTDSITSEIKLGLGCTNMPTVGTAYFANLNFTSLTEDEYKNEILAYDTENLPSNVLLATNVPEDEDEETNQLGKFDPFAFSTIVIAIAVIFAVIGLTIKKVKQNAPKRTKKVSNNYDRLQTLMKDVDRRERKTAINHKLKLLKEELDQSQTFLAQEINDLRKQTESYNTAKEIAQDNPAIELDEPDVKQIQKEIEVQTAKIKQIEEDIAILEEEKERIEAQNKKAIEKRNTSKNSKSK